MVSPMALADHRAARRHPAPLNVRPLARPLDRRLQRRPRRHTIRSSFLLLFTYDASYSIFAGRFDAAYLRAPAPAALGAVRERYGRDGARGDQVLVLRAT